LIFGLSFFGHCGVGNVVVIWSMVNGVFLATEMFIVFYLHILCIDGNEIIYLSQSVNQSQSVNFNQSINPTNQSINVSMINQRSSSCPWNKSTCGQRQPFLVAHTPFRQPPLSRICR
jgi:hypothetical protein